MRIRALGELGTVFGQVLPLPGSMHEMGAGHVTPHPLSGITSFSAKWEELEPLYLPHGGVAGSQRKCQVVKKFEQEC